MYVFVYITVLSIVGVYLYFGLLTSPVLGWIPALLQISVGGSLTATLFYYSRLKSAQKLVKCNIPRALVEEYLTSKEPATEEEDLVNSSPGFVEKIISSK